MEPLNRRIGTWMSESSIQPPVLAALMKMDIRLRYMYLYVRVNITMSIRRCLKE